MFWTRIQFTRVQPNTLLSRHWSEFFINLTWSVFTLGLVDWKWSSRPLTNVSRSKISSSSLISTYKSHNHYVDHTIIIPERDREQGLHVSTLVLKEKVLGISLHLRQIASRERCEMFKLSSWAWVVRLRVLHSSSLQAVYHCAVFHCRGRFNCEYLAVWRSTRWPYTNTIDEEQLEDR